MNKMPLKNSFILIGKLINRNMKNASMTMILFILI